MESVMEEEIHYTKYEDLNPSTLTEEEIIQKILAGLKAPETEWKQHFESLTLLRSMNKNNPEKYIDQLFPQVIKYVVTIVEGLRSKLSKEALTLLYETVKYNKLTNLEETTLNILVQSLFKMSNSQKKFIKQQARASITELQQLNHEGLSYQLSLITLNNNYNISQLAIFTIKKRLATHMISNKSPNFNSFMKLIIGNLNAGRAILEKTAKQILKMIKSAHSDKVFQEQILKNLVLSEEEQKHLKQAIVQKQVKSKANFKDFLKNKKQQVREQSKEKQNN